MNVIRPGELKRLLPYLRLDGADRAYLEAIDALIESDHTYDFKIKVLGILNNFLERDFALQTEQKLGELDAPEPSADISSLERLASVHAGSPLGEVYAETLRLAKQRSQSLESRQSRAEMLAASRALLLEKLLFVKSSVAAKQSPKESIDRNLDDLLASDFPDDDFLKALGELQQSASY